MSFICVVKFFTPIGKGCPNVLISICSAFDACSPIMKKVFAIKSGVEKTIRCKSKSYCIEYPIKNIDFAVSRSLLKRVDHSLLLKSSVK